MTRVVTTLVANDLRRNLRSGFFVLIGIVAPLVLAIVFNMVFGGTASGRLEIPVAIVDEDRSERSADIEAMFSALDDDGLLAVHALADGTEPAEAIGDGDLAAVVVVPAGYGAAVESPGGEPVLELVADPDAPTSAGIVRSIVDEFTRGSDRFRLLGGAAATLGVEPPARVDPLVTTVDRVAESRLDPAALIAASMASLFMLIVAVLGVTSLLEERREGTLARVLAAPIPWSGVIVAKVLVSVLLGTISALALVVAVGVLLGAAWGPPLGVVALVVAFATAAAAFTLVVAGAARTAETAQNVQGTVAVPMAILGGGMFPVPDGGIFGFVRRLTPHHWFLEGLRSISIENSTAAAVPALGALGLFTVVLGVPGLLLAQRRLGR